MTLTPREEAAANQKLASDPARSVFVTANAGSGKTKVLVDRIARLLLQGSKPSAFLCITYTKAAAAEMQRRLYERLGGWCVADDATLGGQLEELGAGRGELGRARALFAQALETPGGLKIQTIHAFCERLLGRFPLEARVPPGFDIADDARAAALLAQARADAALSPDAPREAFRRFAAVLAPDDVASMLDRLALRRAEFRAFARADGELSAAQALRRCHGAAETADAFSARFLAGIDWDSLRAAVGLLEGSTSNDRKAGDRLRKAVDASFDQKKAMAACFDFALTGKGKPYDTIVTAAFEKRHPLAALELQRFASACAEAYDQLKAIERAEDAVAALSLALKLDESYAEAKARAGVLDFDDLIERTHDLLNHAETAPWVLFKLDGGLDHILIDEGQDTSPSQWDLLAPLANEFFAGAGARERVRTVFAVGDPKQSIYGFQGADPARFLRERQTLARAAGPAFAGPELRTSFRSTQQVLDVVDRTFKNLPLIVAEPETHDEIVHLAARDGEGGVVEVWPLVKRTKPEEAQPWDAPIDSKQASTASATLARELAKSVKAMISSHEAVWDKGQQRAMTAGDVLVLVRKRGALFFDLLKAFKSAGLPVAGADRMVLREDLAVEDCLALMRVALDPADDLSLACVLKGPWCNLVDDDRDLFPLAYGRSKGETLLSRLRASQDERYASARDFVDEVIARAGAGAFEFLSWALETRHGGGPSGWMRVFSRLGPEARDPLEELLQRALKPPRHAAPTLQRFVSDIDSDAGQVKRELEAQTDAVRIMTVHGAKGLEAPVVILPDTTAGVDTKPDNGVLFDEDGPCVSFSARGDDERVAKARAAYGARMTSEHWRLLYVAMTRARDRLIICGKEHGNSKSGESSESWRLAVESAMRELRHTKIETPFGEGLRLGEVTFAPTQIELAQRAHTVPVWAQTTIDVAASPAPASPSRLSHLGPALFSPRGEGEKRFRRGRLIHGLLERLPDISPKRRADVGRAWLTRQGVVEADAELYVSEALRVVQDERFAAVFQENSRAEAPIIGDVAGISVRGVVDRLAVDDKRVLVLDFKTDRPAPAQPPQAYALQLALYREVLRRVFPNRSVHCALLWTEAPKLMELPEALLDEALTQFGHG